MISQAEIILAILRVRIFYFIAGLMYNVVCKILVVCNNHLFFCLQCRINGYRFVPISFCAGSEDSLIAISPLLAINIFEQVLLEILNFKF